VAVVPVVVVVDGVVVVVVAAPLPMVPGVVVVIVVDGVVDVVVAEPVLIPAEGVVVELLFMEPELIVPEGVVAETLPSLAAGLFICMPVESVVAGIVDALEAACALGCVPVGILLSIEVWSVPVVLSVAISCAGS
jgi:hypothetical protein